MRWTIPCIIGLASALPDEAAEKQPVAQKLDEFLDKKEPSLDFNGESSDGIAATAIHDRNDSSPLDFLQSALNLFVPFMRVDVAEANCNGSVGKFLSDNRLGEDGFADDGDDFLWGPLAGPGSMFSGLSSMLDNFFMHSIAPLFEGPPASADNLLSGIPTANLTAFPFETTGLRGSYVVAKTAPDGSVTIDQVLIWGDHDPLNSDQAELFEGGAEPPSSSSAAATAVESTVTEILE